MIATLTEVLDAMRALPRAERAGIARELIASLETTHEYDERRYAELKASVQVGVDEIGRGETIRIPSSQLREYLRELGREATVRVAR